MERVMSELANRFVAKDICVRLILLTKAERFFEVDERVEIIEPDFTINQMSRFRFQLLDFLYLRKELRRAVGSSVLSFGGKYNAFVLLASIGSGVGVFISDRSRPTISYGTFLNVLNPLVYRLAAGIIAQTAKAKEVLEDRTSHKNIKVIPNPINPTSSSTGIREQVILNVGRFIKSKNQQWLLDYFYSIGRPEWTITFVGDGQNIESVKSHATLLGIEGSVVFTAAKSDIEAYYAQASIFAFTSTSEGFPNALGEAMAAGCACISFDCEAGPADLIDDGLNGFLIPEGNHELYKEKLQLLIDDSDLRLEFGRKAVEKMKKFSVEIIAKEYLDFLQL